MSTPNHWKIVALSNPKWILFPNDLWHMIYDIHCCHSERRCVWTHLVVPAVVFVSAALPHCWGVWAGLDKVLIYPLAGPLAGWLAGRGRFQQFSCRHKPQSAAEVDPTCFTPTSHSPTHFLRSRLSLGHLLCKPWNTGCCPLLTVDQRL